jgi:hypothetical protein
LNIYQKLIEVRKTVPYLQKENSGSQYKYVSSSQVLGNCISKMNELGLLLVARIIKHNVTESPIEQKDDKGNVLKRTITYFTEIDVEFTWVNAEKPEEKIICEWYGQGVDIAGEKGLGKALTYAEKYFMLKFFNIATDKDDPDAFQEKHDIEPDEKKKKLDEAITAINKKVAELRANKVDDGVIGKAIVDVYGKANYAGVKDASMAKKILEALKKLGVK